MKYLVTLILSSFLPFCSAEAGEVAVKVFKDGKPALETTVCAGSKQQRSLFGLKTTDNEGNVFFDKLPEGKVLLTAEQSGLNTESELASTTIKQTVYLYLKNNAPSLCSNETH